MGFSDMTKRKNIPSNVPTHLRRIFPMSRSVSFVVTAILITAILSAGNVLYAGEYDKGKALYEENCTMCHGANGKGDGPAAASLSAPPKDFNRPEFWKQKNVDQLIAKQVKNGKGEMPAFPLSDDEIKAIIDFMSHSFNK
jgi:cytochrome c5